jgi:hypothetical protein
VLLATFAARCDYTEVARDRARLADRDPGCPVLRTRCGVCRLAGVLPSPRALAFVLNLGVVVTEVCVACSVPLVPCTLGHKPQCGFDVEVSLV